MAREDLFENRDGRLVVHKSTLKSPNKLDNLISILNKHILRDSKM